MKAKINTQLMHPEGYYHIYNRGINGEQLFKQERNYFYFLKQYSKYIEPIAITFAYVLMGNHFHFFIQIKKAEEMRQNLISTSDKSIESIISNQFAKLFNSYAQAINNQEQRTGGLFEETFRRIPVNSIRYAAQVVYYIHFNPQKHKFVSDFKNYPYSSYDAFIRTGFTRIPREQVFKWFAGKNNFLSYHGETQHFDDECDLVKNNWIEFD